MILQRLPLTAFDCSESFAIDLNTTKVYARSTLIYTAYLEGLAVSFSYNLSLKFPQFCLDFGTAVQCSGSSALQCQPRQQTTRCCKQTFAYY